MRRFHFVGRFTVMLADGSADSGARFGDELNGKPRCVVPKRESAATCINMNVAATSARNHDFVAKRVQASITTRVGGYPGGSLHSRVAVFGGSGRAVLGLGLFRSRSGGDE